VSTEHAVTQHTDAANIIVVVNGDAREVRAGETITGLVRDLELDPERLAVELDRRIIKRAQWASTPLQAGAQIEIVQFVGGG
jgi:thiamine biosynthesis protein ThiS